MVAEAELTRRFTEASLGAADAGARAGVEFLLGAFVTLDQLGGLTPRNSSPRLGGAALAGFNAPETFAAQPVTPGSYLSEAEGYAVLAQQFPPSHN